MSDPATTEEIERTLGAERVGPAMWGEIYRSRGTSTYLRVVQNGTRGLTARRRQELDTWPRMPPSPGLAPVREAGQRPLLRDRWFHCVEYEADGVPLTRILSDGHATERTGAASRVLRALPMWWDTLGKGLLPMAADIVLVDGEPLLLRIPRWGVPGPAALMAEPSRALHLAPELARGTAREPDGAADLFALGAALSRCAFEPEAAHGATVLQRAAGGTAHVLAHRSERLPGWTTGMPMVATGVGRLNDLVAPDPALRAATGLNAVAVDLSACAGALDPVASVERLLGEQGDEAALLLAQEALLDEESYELCLLAGRIAADRLKWPLPALTFLDEAVRLQPDRPEAYAAQFGIVARLHELIIAALSEVNGSFAERLDSIMDEALAHFDGPERDRRLPEMADYLTARGHSRSATKLLHPALVEDGVHAWWKFGHMLAYGRAFLAAGECDSARAVAGQVRDGLLRVRRNQSVGEADIGRHGLELVELEEAIRRRCRDGG
jgi:hypothetical protein